MVFLAGWAALAACERGGPPPPKEKILAAAPKPQGEAPSPRVGPVSETERLAEIKKKFHAMYPPEFWEADRRRREKDTKKYVKPAPPGFKPSGNGRKMILTLIPEKTTLRAGERFRYRAELQNVGTTKVHFMDFNTIFKTGNIMRSSEFHVLTPDGKSRQLLPIFVGGSPGGTEYRLPGQERMTEQEIDERMRGVIEEAKYKDNLDVYLEPGQAVVTKPRDGVGEFNTLYADYASLPGNSFGLKLVYKDPPLPPPAEKDFQRVMADGYSREWATRYFQDSAAIHLGIIESNVVRVTISQ